MTKYTANPLLWVLFLVLAAAILIVVRQRKAAAALRQEIDGLREHYTDLEHHYTQSVASAQEQADEATKTVLKSAMRTLQGLAAEQQLILSRLQVKYGESVILQDLLEVDHTNSQFGRRAQSIAVLCGGWLGRHRDVASVYDVVRSAQGRIRHYRRVEILSQVDFGISSRAVEPVALALAELFDNATSYSSPDTVVEVNIRTVPKGVVVVVDDAGVGMNDEERARAERLLTTDRVAGVGGLGNPPQFGLAVIGVLSERFGFEVSVDSSSPYGGVRSVLLLPHELLTNMPERRPQQPAPGPAQPQAPVQGQAPVPVARPAAQPVPLPAAAVPPAAIESFGSTDDGLPIRRRKRPMAIVPTAESAPYGAPAAPAAPASRSGAQTAAMLGAFQRGTRSGRATQRDDANQTTSTRGASSEGHEFS
ncbi:ATP-binding protein [Kitasatospora cineracea]|uniref:histidine kinase n=1 Tax=Kitasatospora cineracea TaxID=88074 RepID=A0A3N4RJX8_9ACTN|nr:ATP-binding protein [Kitasatospora cineracea]ROR43336.1 signal transduction histidine kinase [Kitasatospora cineracea]RPE33708.1 signal transduction histidine kinase [Kitasatospora cineracea]